MLKNCNYGEFFFQANHDRDTECFQTGYGQPLNRPVDPGLIIEIL